VLAGVELSRNPRRENHEEIDLGSNVLHLVCWPRSMFPKSYAAPRKSWDVSHVFHLISMFSPNPLAVLFSNMKIRV
jgi:hypothetical protein